MSDWALNSLLSLSFFRSREWLKKQFPAKAADNAKIAITLDYVGLGHIKLLVQEGFESNRTYLIRTAIQSQPSHQEVRRTTLVKRKERDQPASLP